MTIGSMHIPVLREEVIMNLLHDKDGRYLDVTSGFGGHSTAILEQLNHGSLIATDQDPDAIKYLKNKFESEKRITIYQSRFSDLDQLLHSEKFDGILADIGVSSYQLDKAERGFSFMKDGPLDMRMNQNIGEDASSWLNNAPEQEISNIIWKYGEEKKAKRIAKAIVEARKSFKIRTTKELAEIILEALVRSSITVVVEVVLADLVGEGRDHVVVVIAVPGVEGGPGEGVAAGQGGRRVAVSVDESDSGVHADGLRVRRQLGEAQQEAALLLAELALGARRQQRRQRREEGRCVVGRWLGGGVALAAELVERADEAAEEVREVLLVRLLRLVVQAGRLGRLEERGVFTGG